MPPSAQKLGFPVLDRRSVEVDGTSYSTALLGLRPVLGGRLASSPLSRRSWASRTTACSTPQPANGGGRPPDEPEQAGVRRHGVSPPHSGQAVPRAPCWRTCGSRASTAAANVVDVSFARLEKNLATGRRDRNRQGVGYRLRREQ